MSMAEEYLSLYPSFDPIRMQVQVFHDRVLMNGDSAVVCKAQFLHLPCAAKYIHPKLAESGNSWQLANFEKGCKILENCHHPNLVTNLSVYRHDSLGVPILLMELMDCSLKEFLEQAGAALPLHTQLNICYDVAQGLEYLHTKDIIHGNLTATNVLLHDGRAKICGVMSLQQNTPDGELSLCPGAPESLPRRSFSFSDYDEVIDCFSFGVLAIHIVTRETPKPHPLALQSSQSSEIERYERSLKKIKSTHPLHPIIIECLNDEPKKRPSAAKLCRDLSDMRVSSEYRVSQEADRLTASIMALQIKHLQKEIGELSATQGELQQQEEEFRKQSLLQQQQAERELREAQVDKEQMERLFHEQKSKLTIKLQEKEEELQQQSEKFQEQSRLREQVESDLQKANVDNREKEALIAMLNYNIDDLRKKIAAASTNVDKYKREVSEEREKRSSELEKIHTKIQELEAARDDYKEKHEEADRTCARLLSQLEQQ